MQLREKSRSHSGHEKILGNEKNVPKFLGRGEAVMRGQFIATDASVKKQESSWEFCTPAAF